MDKEKRKIQIDILLTILLVFCMGIQLWPLLAHEVAGTLMFICLGIHTKLNWSWYKAMAKGNYTPMRVIILVVAVLLWLDMLALLCSSLAISYYVLRYVPSPVGISLGRIMHLAASYWAIVLMGLHLGLHWSKFVGKLTVDWCSIGGKCLKFLGLLAAVYGLYSFWQLGWWDYLWLNAQFVSFEGLESPWIFYPTCLCILGGGIWIGYYGMKLLRRIL